VLQGSIAMKRLMTTQVQSTPHKLIFELVLHHDDYIEFSVSYYLEYNLWTAAGIGWISNGTPTYYLNSLKLNKFRAGMHYTEKATIHQQDLSLKFQNNVIESLTLINIQEQFSCCRTHMKPRPN
jgi:hypothetical protein